MPDKQRTFDLIAPNAYGIRGQAFYEICFAVNENEFLQTAGAIADAVSSIGELKVFKSDIEVVRKGRSEPTKDRAPLKEYLKVLGDHGLFDKVYGRVMGISNSGIRSVVPDLGHIVWADTEPVDYHISSNATITKRKVVSPQEGPEEIKTLLMYPNGEKKTIEGEPSIEEMEAFKKETDRIAKELFEKAPDSTAALYVVPAQNETYRGREQKADFVGLIGLDLFKPSGAEKIKKAEDDLKELLKKSKGPPLSFDAADILRQSMRLFIDAPAILQRYGDVLTNENWKSRLFRVDP